jgi:hypothetical protein
MRQNLSKKGTLNKDLRKSKSKAYRYLKEEGGENSKSKGRVEEQEQHVLETTSSPELSDQGTGQEELRMRHKWDQPLQDFTSGS